MKIFLTCRDKFVKWFVRQSIKGGRFAAFFKNYKFGTADKIFETLSEELDMKRKICDVIEAYVENMKGRRNNRKKALN